MNGTRPYKSAYGHDIGHDMSCAIRVDLRDSNPARGEMFIETGATKHVSNSVGVTREIAVRNTYRSYGAWWLGWLACAINVTLLTEFRR